MKRRFLIALGVSALVLSTVPGHADDDPVTKAQKTANAHLTNLTNNANRFPPGNPGDTRSLTLVFGPFTIPPGWDRNQVTVDLPIQTGFYTKVFPNLVDVNTGAEPTEQDAHIHHAHWFRVVKTGSGYEKYSIYEPVEGAAELSWVFGTGEERTGGTLVDRESPQEGWKYGIFLDGSTPQVLIFMIHNKNAAAMNAYITLDIDMVYGSRQEIMRATHQDIHPLTGVLTGTTKDIQADKSFGFESENGVLKQDYTADMSGTLVASGSHMHPGGKWVYVTNLGPRKTGNSVDHPGANDLVCAGADLDGDGIPGTTLIVSKKVDQDPAVWPYSESYQMGGTQGGFRAPIHQGDVIRQYGIYDVDRSSVGTLIPSLLRANPLDVNAPLMKESLDGLQHAWYAAMSYTGLYVDEYNKPVLAQGVTSGSCNLGTFASKLIPSAGFNASTTPQIANDPNNANPLSTYTTHGWLHFDPHCGPGTVDKYGTVTSEPCDAAEPTTFVPGQVVDTIQVANFAYIPGDLKSFRNPDNSVSVPQVQKGTPLTLVNEDFAIGVRHTFTSCPSPCDGPYVANYPAPDGTFESGKLGNLDPVDGGVTTGRDTEPYKVLQTASLSVGRYNFFCTIHPWMRGVFDVI